MTTATEASAGGAATTATGAADDHMLASDGGRILVRGRGHGHHTEAAVTERTRAAARREIRKESEKEDRGEIEKATETETEMTTATARLAAATPALQPILALTPSLAHPSVGDAPLLRHASTINAADHHRDSPDAPHHRHRDNQPTTPKSARGNSPPCNPTPKNLTRTDELDSRRSKRRSRSRGKKMTASGVSVGGSWARCIGRRRILTLVSG